MHRLINELLRGLLQECVVGGGVALDNVEDVARFLVDFRLFDLADLEAAEDFVGGIAVAVFVGLDSNGLRHADGLEPLRAVGEPEGHVAVGAVHVVGAQRQLRLQRQQIVNVHRLIEVEHLMPLLQQLDEILAGRNVLPPLDAGLVVEHMEPFQDGILMRVYPLVLLIERLQPLFAILRPLLTLAVIVHSLYRHEQDLEATVENLVLYEKFHVWFLLGVMRGGISWCVPPFIS